MSTASRAPRPKPVSVSTPFCRSAGNWFTCCAALRRSRPISRPASRLWFTFWLMSVITDSNSIDPSTATVSGAATAMPVPIAAIPPAARPVAVPCNRENLLCASANRRDRSVTCCRRRSCSRNSSLVSPICVRRRRSPATRSRVETPAAVRRPRNSCNRAACWLCWVERFDDSRRARSNSARSFFVGFAACASSRPRRVVRACASAILRSVSDSPAFSWRNSPMAPCAR